MFVQVWQQHFLLRLRELSAEILREQLQPAFLCLQTQTFTNAAIIGHQQEDKPDSLHLN